MFESDNCRYFGNTNYGKSIFTKEITIPNDYVFENYLDSFFKDSNRKYSSRFLLTDENFKNVSTVMLPGEKYQVSLFPIINYISHCQHCINDLLMKNISFVGAQGLVLFDQLFEKYRPFSFSWIPDSGRIISFDKKENLFYDNSLQIEKVPYLECRKNTFEKFSTFNFWSSLSSQGEYLLIFEKI